MVCPITYGDHNKAAADHLPGCSVCSCWQYVTLFREINSFGWYNDTVKNSSITTKSLYLILTLRSHHEIFIRRSWYSVLPSLDATISCRIKKAVVGVTQLNQSVESRLRPLSWCDSWSSHQDSEELSTSFFLMKISWWDRNVKIRYKLLVVIDEFLTEYVTLFLICHTNTCCKAHFCGRFAVALICSEKSTAFKTSFLWVPHPHNVLPSSTWWGKLMPLVDQIPQDPGQLANKQKVVVISNICLNCPRQPRLTLGIKNAWWPANGWAPF